MNPFPKADIDWTNDTNVQMLPCPGSYNIYDESYIKGIT